MNQDMVLKNSLENEVHIWLCDPTKIEEPLLLQAYLKMLNEAEAVQQKRFYFEKDRHSYLVTRAMIRTLLSRYLGGDPARWCFVKNEFGRPSLDPIHEEQELSFNISHSLGLIGIAFARKRELGFDLENQTRGGDLLPLANRFFAPLEASELRSLPEAQQESRFFDYWTLKESYIKARGKGLAIPLDQFAFKVDASNGVGFWVDPKQADDPERWAFFQWQKADHKLALTLERKFTPAQPVFRNYLPLLGDSFQTLDLLRCRK